MPATVVNVTAFKANGQSIIGFDTNVLIGLGYSKASLDPARRARFRYYEAFIRKASVAGASWRFSPLNIVEAIHLIERLECQVAGFKAADVKAFRADPANRLSISSELAVLWSTVASLGSVLETYLDHDSIQHFIRNQQAGQLDAYDMALIESYLAAGVTMILTDDGDFSTYDRELTVLTANQACLSTALANGSLVTT